jgi:putative membrane protein
MRAHSPDDCTIRDELALERTLLANERTFLAYIRTTLALWAGTAALVHLFSGFPWSRTLASILLAAGAMTLGAGLYRFFRTGSRLKSRRVGGTTDPD